ncbi:MAG TPA: hypothetical protein VMG31_13590 [Verrucomicrobiae bacterium]|nr:hypothetical protein [Verrucomicrobiae bacterium]
MKFATVSKSVLMGLAVLLASSAFAATKANLVLNSPAVISGTTLKAGSYKLEWDGTGPDVQVSVIKGKTVVTKVPAKLVDLKVPAANDAAVLSTTSDGSNMLTGARFEGKKYGLDLASASDGAGSGK